MCGHITAAYLSHYARWRARPDASHVVWNESHVTLFVKIVLYLRRRRAGTWTDYRAGSAIHRQDKEAVNLAHRLSAGINALHSQDITLIFLDLLDWIFTKIPAEFI